MINIIIWSMGIGICLCIFYIYYNKTVAGKIVHALIEREAYSDETAFSLEQLGMEKNSLLKRKLASGSASLTGVVAEGNVKNTYYIPAEKRQKAVKMFASGGTSLVMSIVLSVVTLVVAYAATLVVPWVISMAQSIF